MPHPSFRQGVNTWLSVLITGCRWRDLPRGPPVAAALAGRGPSGREARPPAGAGRGTRHGAMARRRRRWGLFPLAQAAVRASRTARPRPPPPPPHGRGGPAMVHAHHARERRRARPRPSTVGCLPHPHGHPGPTAHAAQGAGDGDRGRREGAPPSPPDTREPAAESQTGPEPPQAAWAPPENGRPARPRGAHLGVGPAEGPPRSRPLGPSRRLRQRVSPQGRDPHGGPYVDSGIGSWFARCNRGF